MEAFEQYAQALGRRLRRERSRRRLSLNKMSQATGLTRKTLREAELGRLSLRTLVKATQALGLVPGQVLGDLDRGADGDLPGAETKGDEPQPRRKAVERSFTLTFEDRDQPAGPYVVEGGGDVPSLGDVVATPDGQQYRVIGRALRIEHVDPHRRGTHFQPLAFRFDLALQRELLPHTI